MKTYVDQDTCIGCGLCTSTCSDVYQINENGKAESSVEVVPPDCEQDCRTAANNCPTGAISVSE